MLSLTACHAADLDKVPNALAAEARMEACGSMTVKAHPHTLERVLTALEKRGVVIEEDGIRLRPKGKGR